MKKAISVLLALMLQIGLFGALVMAEEQNLAKGKNVSVCTGYPVTKSYSNYSEEFDVQPSRLTDGTLGSGSLDGSWYTSFRGYSRIVTIDLGEVQDVASVTAGFYHSKNEAYYMPREFTVSLSEDGEGYQKVAEISSPRPLSDEKVGRIAYEADFSAYKARFVKVEYTVDIFAACDEICVYAGTNGKSIVPDTLDKANETPTSLDGAKNIIKMYNGYYPQQDIGDDTYEELLPYIAYLNKKGEITDVMFDGLAFVPCHTDYPSGGRLTKMSGKPAAIKSDWDLYIENTFKDGVNLDALDDVVGDVYEKLGIKDTYPVFLTMPFPTVSDGPFGDLNGDGFDEYCSTLDERFAILKHYTDEYISRFNTKGYKNLRFSGFYWYREEVNFSESDHEDMLVIKFNEYVHSKGLKTIYDPFFLSTGFDIWRELGFDACVMQPNFAEIYSDRTYYKEGMLEEFASSLSQFSLGVELETVSQGAFQGNDYLRHIENYLSYLRSGVKYGYDNVVKTFYQGGGPGTLYDFCKADTSKSKGAMLRYLYDQTYLFISGKMTVEAPMLSGKTEIETQCDKRARETVEVTDSDSANYELSLKVVTEPQHGKVAPSTYNGYTYRPDKGFVGTDSFVLVASDGYSDSNPITVTVNVTEADESDVSVQTESSVSPTESDAESISVDNKQNSGSIIPFVALGAAVLAAAAIAIVIFKRKK